MAASGFAGDSGQRREAVDTVGAVAQVLRDSDFGRRKNAIAIGVDAGL